MGTYLRHVGALLRRNLVFRKRAWLSSIFQLLLPSAMLLILLLIKVSLKDNDAFKPQTIPAVIPEDSIRPFSFLDYVTAILEPRKCVTKSKFSFYDRELRNLKYEITGINLQDWPVPFVKCDAFNCTSDGEDASKACATNILALAPKTAGEDERMMNFKEYIYSTYPQLEQFTDYDIVQTFDDSAAIDDYVKSPDYGVVEDSSGGVKKPKIALAVVIGGEGKEYDYAIRTNSTNWNNGELNGRPGMITQPNTDREINSFAKQAASACPVEPGTVRTGNREYESNCNVQYMHNGALTIQRLVDDFILSDTGAVAAGFSVAENGVSFADFPSKSYVQDGFYEITAAYVPLLLLLGLLFPFAAMCRSIVAEKELRQKELMKMMSISESALELSWFISLYGFSFISGVLLTIFSSLFYEKASPLALFIFWQFFFISVVMFSMFISAFFTKATRVTLVGIIAFFVGYFLTLSADIETGNVGLINLVSLHPVTALSYGVKIIGNLEDAGAGITPSTLTFTEYPSGYTFLTSLSSFIVSSIYFGFLTFYTNRVYPGAYGKAVPWNFLFKKSYWCPSKIVTEDLQQWKSNEKYESLKIEPPSVALQQQELDGTGVHIRGLTKEFGDKTAVSELELSMYEGQVFALLGHNGAGKTTTINMLTGMLAPTSGYAIIDGKSVNTQMPEIRESLGICLQHDCLFDQLTVKEHLQFFARVKGLYGRVSYEEAEESIDASIRDVALFEKRNSFSKDLSGGMKRKLSLAIAFCGDSKVVFLDEPTSGMDTFSRRFIWNVIRQSRQDRTIILTTHFMDEADLLGDRIGIMSQGQLCCLGSSLFLKREFGVGYQITIEKKSESLTVDETVTDIVMSSVPQASVLSNVSSELSFQIPLDASSSFTQMFAELDRIVESQEISMYGVSITTLEEVFLMVARGETGDRQILASSTKDSMKGISLEAEGDNSNSYRSTEDLKNSQMFSRHVQSLLTKRALNFKRDKKAWVCSTILPCLFAFFGFMIATLTTQFKSLEPLDLNLSNYNPSLEGDKTRYPTALNKAESFPCQPGKCMSTYPGYYSSYCGNFTTIDDTCYSTDVSGISDALTNDEFYVLDQDVASVTEASEQLLGNVDEFKLEASQYGAFYFTHSVGSYINGVANDLYETAVENLCSTNGGDIINGFDCARFSGLGLIVATNFTAPHASLVYQALADEAIVNSAVGADHSIKVTIDPLPYTELEETFTGAADAFNAWFYLVLSFPFITGAFITFIVQEKISKAKHLQTVAGVKPVAYWLSSYLWDICNYQFPLWIIVIFMYAFGVESFTTSEDNINAGTLLLLILFGPAAAGFTYLLSFLFKSPSSGNMFVIVFNFFIGFAGSLVCLILRAIHFAIIASQGTSNLLGIAQIVEWILRFIPSFNFAKGLLFAINIQLFKFSDPDVTAFSPDVMLYEIIFLAWQSIVYIGLAIYIDTLLTNQKLSNLSFKRRTQSQTSNSAVDEDEDVIAETQRILSGEANDDAILLSDLKKEYPNGKLAVDGLSFGIPAGQCFGLLGINGAGKTTTMAMLTAEFPPTGGDATLSGYSITTQPEETRRRCGYCPQFDAHFVNMTGREHVKLYAAIKGVPKEFVDEAAGMKLAEVGLNEYDSDQVSSGYSGGMKRKLSVACATIGNPKIVFLDEPSTGMDPASRRDLWKVISNMVTGSDKTSVILTTHSMEECEALCPRIGIMAGGKLKCIGSAQHLKTRYGQGYQMEIKVGESAEGDSDYEEVLDKVLNSAGGGNVDEVYLDLEKAIAAARKVSGDSYLSEKLTEDDATGYFLYKNATSNIGVSATELSAFCSTELRMRSVTLFLENEYPGIILREREDTRIRFEVPSEGTKISSLFKVIEENKEKLFVAEYGISQTTLEQVFNMHAAVAEQMKQGTDDG